MRDPVTVEQIHFVRAFPWLRIGRGLGCALAPQAIALALAATLLHQLVYGLCVPPPTPAELSPKLSPPPWLADSGVWLAAKPVRDVLTPLGQMSTASGLAMWRLLGGALASFAIWSFAAVAICRCVAVDFCRDESPSFRDAVNRAVQRAAVPWGALATPLGGAAVLGVLIALLALPAFVPALGAAWVTIIAPVMTLLSLGVAFILLAVVVMWPLMMAAIAVDDSDSFDAFSKAFSYLTTHPIAALLLGLLAAGAAVIVGRLFEAIGATGVEVAVWSARWTASDYSVGERVAPNVAWWSQIFVNGLRASLFWSLTTIVYLFLRHATDGVPMDQIKGFDEPLRSRDPFPVVGIPAVNPPPAEPSA